jgi:tyrosine-protein phosphatase YwqE
MLLFYSQSRAESNAPCLEAGDGEINFFVDVRHVLPEKFNNKDAKVRRKNFSDCRQTTDSDLKIAHGKKIQISPASRKAVSTIEA